MHSTMSLSTQHDFKNKELFRLNITKRNRRLRNNAIKYLFRQRLFNVVYAHITHNQFVCDLVCIKCHDPWMRRADLERRYFSYKFQLLWIMA